MPVQRLMPLMDSTDYLMSKVHWKGLPESKDSSGQVRKVYKDVPELVFNLLRRKSAPPFLVSEVLHILSFRKKGE